MLRKPITYTDYDGNERTEVHYFNLNRAEVVKMEMSTSAGLSKELEKIIETNDAPSIIKFMEDLILKSYGEKTPDGRRFVKSPELSEEFSQTEAYTQLFMELCTNSEAAADFVNRVIPSEI